MNEFASLHNHSQYSLLDGLSKGWQMAARSRQLGLKACALTDHGTLAGSVSFLTAMKNACKHCGYQPNQHFDGGKGSCSLHGVVCPGYEKEPMKPILGCEFYVSGRDASDKDKDNKTSHLCVLAKNLQGWKNLVQASSASNSPDYFYRNPRLDLERLGGFAKGEWVAFSGHPGSELANAFFHDLKAGYGARTYDEAKAQTKPWGDLKRELVAIARKYEGLFGKGNFFIEKQRIDACNMPAAEVIYRGLAWLAKETGIPEVATGDAHYPAREDAEDQRILLCSAVDTTLVEAERKLTYGEDFGLSGFFRSSRFHIPSVKEMADLHTPQELASTIAIAEMCESYDITSKPQLPQFVCPNGLSTDDYLKKLCVEGWRKKVEPVLKADPSKKQAYADRVRMELGVLQEAGLAPYFLIVHDICHHSQTVLGCKPSKGRGSAAGCLITHLLNIADCDPIKHDLLFERFYNAGRNDVKSGRVSLPDIDMDFPISLRGKVIECIRTKYGDAHVAQMATFGRMQGRDAIKSVLRAHEWGSFDERQAITAFIPDESAIADELQEMREETGEASIIKWALENDAASLKQWCELKEDGTLDGPLARYFAQAMRLEGTKKTQGKHAAGIVIFPEPLADHFPMLYDKSTGRSVVGYEMVDVEAAGGVKLDCLGVAGLDKVMGTVRTIASLEVGVAV